MSQRIVFHVGASKCGTSALQTALSKGNEFLSKDGKRYVYAVFHPREGIFFGDDLKSRLSRSPHGYIISTDIKTIRTLENDWYVKTRKKLAKIFSSYDGAIFSNEGWFHRAFDFSELRFFEKLEINVDVIAYVRPQVPFMNSAWWQWGAWSGRTLDQYIKQRLPSTHWHLFVEKWHESPFVSSISTRLLNEDIVSDFFENLGLIPDFDKEPKVNKGLPSEILRLYQRHPFLRPSSHASAIDFVLSRRLALNGETPWVITHENVKNIIENCFQSNQELKNHLSDDSAGDFLADQRWWDPGFYAKKKPVPWQPVPAADEKMDLLCAKMVATIFEMDQESKS